MILNPNKIPEFLLKGSGGSFKDNDPNVPIEDLQSKWVEDTLVVYIGETGSGKSKETLHSRLTKFLEFGHGEDIGHWGGRFVWQLKNSKDLLICWKVLAEEEPKEIKAELLESFKSQYQKRPFANIK